MNQRCHKCGGPLIVYLSFGYKQCADCGLKVEVKLWAHEQPLIKHQR